MTQEALPGVPAPLREALAAVPVPQVTTVAGCDISWLSWGDAARQPVVFVHGGAAHSWWWSFTAPLLSDRYHVVALDLSGHGDSGHRAHYSFAGWVEEVAAVVERLPGGLPPIVVGHSMGGMVATLFALEHGSRMAGLISIDSPLSKADAANFTKDNGVLAQTRSYSSRDEAVARFRLLPPQDVVADELLAHVARHSVASTGDGRWSWKFDAKVFLEHPEDRPKDLLGVLDSLVCPLGVIAAEKSDVVPESDRERIADLARTAPAERPVVYWPIDGGHHLMFDRPLELVAAIRDTIEEWRSRRKTAEEAGS